MSTLDDFATRVDTIEKLREPFRTVFLGRGQPQGEIRFLAYSPAFAPGSARIPASVFAVEDNGWCMALEGSKGKVSVLGCTFDDTLLLELTSILLHGQLKIDFIGEGRARTAAVQFNTVGMKEYRAALELILDGIQGMTSQTTEDIDSWDPDATWPYKFRSLSRHYVPNGRLPQDAVHWPTIHGGFGREIAPAGALLRTERELVLISEERKPIWFRPHNEVKLGVIVTYFPLNRLAKFHLAEHHGFSTLGLEAHASHGGERLDVLFASDRTDALLRLMNGIEQSVGTNSPTLVD